MGLSNEKVFPMMTELWHIDLPDESSWCISPADEDGLLAKEELMGLDEVQAHEKLIRSGSSYSEWLEFLPKQPFQFYLKILIKYLLSQISNNDFGASSSLFSFLPRKIEKCPECFEGIEDILPSLLFEIAKKQKAYDADIDLFGDFSQHASVIYSLLKNKQRRTQ
jgi:hypothetical protein